MINNKDLDSLEDIIHCINFSVLISNILKEKEIIFKLVNSIEDINLNEEQRKIILFHFDVLDNSDFINENIKVINLKD